ncbi:MAG: squalene synthase HpnC [Pseudomonadota bacterium]
MTAQSQYAGTPGLHHGVAHYENFPVASVLCPPRFRPAIAAIYGFARTADDLADEGDASPPQRLEDLANFAKDLKACVAGHAVSDRWPQVFAPLGRAIAEWNLPVPLLEDLLSAFEQDVMKTRYDTQADLLDYCRRSANPVGRLLLHLYQVDDAESLAHSDAICTALQLINFWQDLSIDIPRGRLYLPAERYIARGVSEAQLMARQCTAATRQVVADVVGEAQALMRSGAPLARRVPGRAGWELRLVVQGGLRIAERIEMTGFNSLLQRPRIGKADALVMLWRAIAA